MADVLWDFDQIFGHIHNLCMMCYEMHLKQGASGLQDNYFAVQIGL